MDLVKFYVECLFQPVFEDDQSSARGEMRRLVDEMLDPSGPKMFGGVSAWLWCYQAIGQMNWLDRPLYVSLAYKLLLGLLVAYLFLFHFLLPVLEVPFLIDVIGNPAFFAVSLLAAITTVAQVLANLYINSFQLCPLMKLLTTKRLCFLSCDAQQVLGNRLLPWMIAFNIYHSIISKMATHMNLDDFIYSFNLLHLLPDLFLYIYGTYSTLGLLHIDFYVRGAFGSWLLALSDAFKDRSRLTAAGPRRGVTLDEIQRCLNNMDDHLEVLRSVQTVPLALLSLSAFLTNGFFIEIAYDMLANRSNNYHGTLLAFISIDYMLLVAFCYFGDSWLYYALSKLVQTIEDEYFLQDMQLYEAESSTNHDGGGLHQQVDDQLLGQAQRLKQVAGSTPGESVRLTRPVSNNQANSISKQNVLFCREFLHQFENHLWTPWSQLTVKKHLNMLGTFVSLIAAQIIFDREH